MTQDFDLRTILTVTTGINCVDDVSKVYELAWFVYDNDKMNNDELNARLGELKGHLLTLYPSLKDVTYNPQVETSFYSWLLDQLLEYGETLPVSKLGESLKKSTPTI